MHCCPFWGSSFFKRSFSLTGVTFFTSFKTTSNKTHKHMLQTKLEHCHWHPQVRRCPGRSVAAVAVGIPFLLVVVHVACFPVAHLAQMVIACLLLLIPCTLHVQVIEVVQVQVVVVHVAVALHDVVVVVLFVLVMSWWVWWIGGGAGVIGGPCGAGGGLCGPRGHAALGGCGGCNDCVIWGEVPVGGLSAIKPGVGGAAGVGPMRVASVGWASWAIRPGGGLLVKRGDNVHLGSAKASSQAASTSFPLPANSQSVQRLDYKLYLYSTHAICPGRVKSKTKTQAQIQRQWVEHYAFVVPNWE